MALDNTVLKIIVADLKKEVSGAFFDVPFNLDYTQFALPYHSAANAINKGRGTLIISLDSTDPFITYSFDRFTKVFDNSAFSNILKRLAGTRLISIEKSAGERVVTLDFELAKRSIETLETGYRLVVELFPQRPNCYLISAATGKIIAMYKERGDLTFSRYMARGLPYIPAEERREIGDDFKDAEELKPYLSRATHALLCEHAEKVGFQTAVSELLASSAIYATSRGLQPLDFGEEAPKVAVEDIYRYFFKDQKKAAFLIRERRLKELIEQRLKTAQKKRQNLQQDLLNSQKRLEFKDFGQILFLYQTEYDGTRCEVVKDGFSIPVDPELSYVENANRYFRRYHKAKSAVPILKDLLISTDDEILYLRKKLLDLENGSARDIQELKTELAATGYLKDKNLERQIKKNPKKRYLPHFLEVDGARIGYGQNDLQNETLTFEIATPRSLFFHVKDQPGAHVVALEGGERKEICELASELALYLSHLSEGEVYVTEVKNVKKNKAKKGLVNILKYQTIAIKKIKDNSLELFRENL